MQKRLFFLVNLFSSAGDKVQGTDGKDVVRGEYHDLIDVACDDFTGAKLDPQEVKKARYEDLTRVRKKKVWTRIT